jgi:Rrf2 family protein
MITKTGLHAVRAMVALGRLPPGEYAGAAEIAHQIGAPPNYLGKLLRTLAAEGLVESQKGLGGGSRLAKPARKISLLAVVSPFESISRWAGCILGHADCSENMPCALHGQWKAIRGAYLRLLESTTVADLLRKGEAVILEGKRP